MNEAPKRRWLPRYSLRMLFVVMTVACCLLGYQLNWIGERHTYLELYGIHSVPKPTGGLGPIVGNVDAPWPLRLLGEQGVGWVVVIVSDEKSNEGKAKIERVRRLFPEAQRCDIIATDRPELFERALAQ